MNGINTRVYCYKITACYSNNDDGYHGFYYNICRSIHAFGAGNCCEPIEALRV